MAQNRQKKGSVALLIIDMINDFRFPDASKLYKRGITAAKAIAKLKARAVAAGCPVIYVNDNFKQWHDSFQTTIEHIEQTAAGKKIVDILRPDEQDYFVLKPQRSGFYETPQEVLLRDLSIREVIVTGITTDMCVLQTAQDAYIRGLGLWVPSDCSAAIETKHHRQALDLLARTTDADIRVSSNIRFD